MLISKFNNNNNEINISDLESILGLSLPEQYVRFLRKYNGGYTPKTEWTGKCRNDIRAFYGFNVDNLDWDIAHNITFDYVKKLINENKFPIAENCFGDSFCIDLLDSSIYFIRHDSSFCQKISDDFYSFIKGCKSKKIGHIRTIEERKKALFENFGEKPTEEDLKGWQTEIDKYLNINQEEIRLV